MAEHGGTTPAGIQLFRTEHESGSERKTAEISQRELDAIKAASSRYFVRVAGVCAVTPLGLIATATAFALSPIAGFSTMALLPLLGLGAIRYFYKSYQKDIAYINHDKSVALKSHYTLELLHKKTLEK